MPHNEPASKSAGSSRSWNTVQPALSEWILDAVSSTGFARMTPVQASTIPLFMGHKDVVVEAVTGSGKTLAYLLPVVEKLLRLEEPIKRHHVGAIVIAPTRELAAQIHSVLCSLLAFHAPSAAAIRRTEPREDENEEDDTMTNDADSGLHILPQLIQGGSTSASHDLKLFLANSPNLLISTPRRLLELLSSPYVHCPQSSFEVLVLDEADRLLDLGFKEDLQKILSKLPKQRRTGLFSASVSEAVGEIIRVGLRNPIKIAVKVRGEAGNDKRTPNSLQMSYIVAPPTHKLPAVSHLLESQQPQKSIIYLSTCAAVDYFQHLLPLAIPSDFDLIPLHGKHPPNVRQKNFGRFCDCVKPTVLLTTDVAARGLDVPSVDLVIQLDPPSDPKAFLHRSGRAGRAGRRGLSVILLHPGREEDYIPFLSVRKTPITQLEDFKAVSDDEATKTIEKLRRAVLKDRALHDKAQRAFVSWVRSYSKHQAASIFRVQDLDWTQLGHAWALLRLPKMPELRGKDGSQAHSRDLGVQVDMESYAYKDKAREKARKDALAKQAIETLEDAAGKSQKHAVRSSGPGSWSRNRSQQQVREERRDKKHRKRETQRQANLTPAERIDEEKLQGLIGEVRRQNQEEWTGFGD